MPLVKISGMLKDAQKNQYGVAAVNTCNYETVKWVIKTAEELSVPVIVQLYPGFNVHIPLRYIAYMAKDMAAASAVPVAVHLDHSANYEIAVTGIKDGFPSIMVDGSRLAFEENVELTSRVVQTARVFGIDVEAELGHVGSGANINYMTDKGRYTDPDQAAEFVRRTNCDLLAVAVGNAHGPYAQDPNLDFDRIKALRSRVEVPLVLHGCSGIPDEQMQRAVELGMCKFNIATEYFRAVGDAAHALIQEGVKSADGLFMKLSGPAGEFLGKKMLLLNPDRKGNHAYE